MVEEEGSKLAGTFHQLSFCLAVDGRAQTAQHSSQTDRDNRVERGRASELGGAPGEKRLLEGGKHCKGSIHVRVRCGRQAKRLNPPIAGLS